MGNRRGGTSGLQERTGQLLLVYLRIRRRMLRRAIRAYKVAADQGHHPGRELRRSDTVTRRTVCAEAERAASCRLPEPALMGACSRLISAWLPAGIGMCGPVSNT